MTQISKTYPTPSLNKDDGEPKWPAGWSLERFNNMNVMEVFDIPHEVSWCHRTANAV
jgi:hypothetical protein